MPDSLTPLAAALRAIEEAHAGEVAPRLREIARGTKDGDARSILALMVSTCAPHADADDVFYLSPESAVALLRELGHSPRGAPVREDARRTRVEVYLSADEMEALDERRGEAGRSEWLARASGLRR